MKSKLTLTLRDYAAIDGQGAVVHCGMASVRRSGQFYLMEGRTGEHRLSREHTDLKRLNAHWVGFAKVAR